MIKFKPIAALVHPAVDICLGVRKRGFSPERNWEHWNTIASALRRIGLFVRLVGGGDTSQTEVESDTRAWEHPDRATAGTVDLLGRCKLYVGTDTGVSHLASLMDTPSLIFGHELPGMYDLTRIMERANKRYYRRLRNAAWDCSDEVLGAAVRRMYRLFELASRKDLLYPVSRMLAFCLGLPL